MASLINGDRQNDEIIDTIQQSLLLEQILEPEPNNFLQRVLNVSTKTQYVLFQMEQEGYLVEQKNSSPSPLDIFCHHLNINPTVAQERLQSTTVAVQTYGAVAAEDLITMLESSGNEASPTCLGAR